MLAYIFHMRQCILLTYTKFQGDEMFVIAGAEAVEDATMDEVQGLGRHAHAWARRQEILY